jgi:tetratricopeptide (TPR) repeat protein
MNKLTVLAFSVSVALASQAQTVQDALKKTDDERYDLARKDFQSLIQKNPTSVEAHYFFGNFYNTIGQTDSAISMWKKAGSLIPEDKLGIIATHKAVYFSGDTATASAGFCTALKATKNKNAMQLMRVGETYATSGKWANPKLAETYLRKSLAIDPNNQEALILLGDVMKVLSPTNATPAVAEYNKVLTLNPNAVNVIVRKAKIYQAVNNYKLANEEYLKAEQLDPNYAPTYMYHAELNMLFGYYAPAIDLWNQYIKLNDNNEARYRLLSAMYGAKKYAETLAELDKLEAKGYTNMYMKRFRSVCLVELNTANDVAQYEKALVASDELFNTADPEKIIGADNRNRGVIYSKLGKDSLAIIEYRKTMDKDTSLGAEMLSEIGKIYVKQKNYDKTIALYTEKEAAYPAKVNATEYFNWALACYFNTKPDYAMADSRLVKVTERAPDFIATHLWRARVALKLDDPKAKKYLAKPHYEKYLTSMTETDKANPNLKANQIEASKYLGDYYLNSPEKNIPMAKEHWNRVRTLDPADAQAKAFFNSALGK